MHWVPINLRIFTVQKLDFNFLGLKACFALKILNSDVSEGFLISLLQELSDRSENYKKVASWPIETVPNSTICFTASFSALIFFSLWKRSGTQRSSLFMRAGERLGPIRDYIIKNKALLRSTRPFFGREKMVLNCNHDTTDNDMQTTVKNRKTSTFEQKTGKVEQQRCFFVFFVPFRTLPTEALWSNQKHDDDFWLCSLCSYFFSDFGNLLTFVLPFCLLAFFPLHWVNLSLMRHDT